MCVFMWLFHSVYTCSICSIYWHRPGLVILRLTLNLSAAMETVLPLSPSMFNELRAQTAHWYITNTHTCLYKTASPLLTPSNHGVIASQCLNENQSQLDNSQQKPQYAGTLLCCWCETLPEDTREAPLESFAHSWKTTSLMKWRSSAADRA